MLLYSFSLLISDDLLICLEPPWSTETVNQMYTHWVLRNDCVAHQLMIIFTASSDWHQKYGTYVQKGREKDMVCGHMVVSSALVTFPTISFRTSFVCFLLILVNFWVACRVPSTYVNWLSAGIPFLDFNFVVMKADHLNTTHWFDVKDNFKGSLSTTISELAHSFFFVCWSQISVNCSTTLSTSTCSILV